MDSHTLELLQFDELRSLLAGYAASSLGRDLARQVEPLSDFSQIRSELALVSEMVEALDLGQSPPLGGLQDVRLLVRRAAIGAMLTAEQLLQVSEILQLTGAIYRYRMRLAEHLTRLIDLLSGIDDLGPVSRTIAGCIDSRGHVLDMASRELGQIRQKLVDVDEKVKAEIRRLLRDPELRRILSYPNATVSGDHYVLPVAANHRAKVPGIVHRLSSTGETVYIEPAAIAHLSAERLALKAEEEREEKRVLRRLSSEVARVSKPLLYSLEVLARLDLITAKARMSREYDMHIPELNNEGRLWLRDARHPLLEHLFRTQAAPPPATPRRVVPIEVRLGYGFNLLIITGPNTGGKTVALKTTGLLCLMALSGVPIPANPGSTIPWLRHVLADIGDEQSLEQSLSTFSSHMSRIRVILEHADPNSLVLLDELGAGTDPTEGAALGRAILDELDRIGCRAMVTTHLGDLKTYAWNNPRAENAAVEFDSESLQPTYRLLIGQYGMSNALKIARRLKLPKGLLARAYRYLKRRRGRSGELARIQELRAQAEKAREEALAAQLAAEREREEYERQKARLAQQTEKEAALHEMRTRLRANDLVKVARFDALGRVVRVDLRKQMVTVSIGLGQWEIPFEEILPAGPDDLS